MEQKPRNMRTTILIAIAIWQQFKLPSGEVITREFLKKKPAAVVVPITTDGNVVCVIHPISFSAEGSLIEVPAVMPRIMRTLLRQL